jgi:hypothetical protein
VVLPVFLAENSQYTGVVPVYECVFLAENSQCAGVFCHSRRYTVTKKHRQTPAKHRSLHHLNGGILLFIVVLHRQH